MKNVSAKTFGYARVSARDQNLDRQMDALQRYSTSMAEIYCDKASGKDFNRPAYKKLLRRIKTGDTLVVKSIDRLGRNYEEILNEWRYLTKEKRCKIVVLDMPLLNTGNDNTDVTRALISDIVLQLLSYVAQVEREGIKQRQAEGIAAAQARGVKFGRPPKQRPESYDVIKSTFVKGGISKENAARKLGVCTNTFMKWVKEDLQK